MSAMRQPVSYVLRSRRSARGSFCVREIRMTQEDNTSNFRIHLM